MHVQAHRVLVVGGGFAGLAVARGLARVAADVTLVDRRNFHLFQPLLYQVATGGLSPAEIASPLRGILRRQPNVRVLLAEATGVDPEARRLRLADGELPYDTLVVATGVRHDYFGRPQWEGLAPGLKTIEDATEIRARVLGAFEAAEREADPARRAAWLSFAIVGGGATGVELAGALAEISRRTLRRDFRSMDPGAARILLVEAADRILRGYDVRLAEKARKALERMGVEVMLRTRVVDVAPDGIAVEGPGGRLQLATRTALWAAGIRAHGFARAFAEATGAESDAAGRVLVGPDLALRDRSEIFVVGDVARPAGRDEPFPGVAPAAIQQGTHVARTIAARLAGRPPPGAFAYRDPGAMAVVGRGMAIAQFRRLRMAGRTAWFAWLFVHLVQILGMENRILVFVQWAWSYVTWNRGARLITGRGDAYAHRAVGKQTSTDPPER